MKLVQLAKEDHLNWVPNKSEQVIFGLLGYDDEEDDEFSAESGADSDGSSMREVHSDPD